MSRLGQAIVSSDQAAQEAASATTQKNPKTLFAPRFLLMGA